MALLDKPSDRLNADFLFAWFTAKPAITAANKNTNIQAAKAEVSGGELVATITATDKPVLTDATTGTAKVYNGSTAVTASNDSTALKRGSGSITFAPKDSTEKSKIAAGAGGLTYNVYATVASGQLRIISQNTSKATTSAVVVSDVESEEVTDSSGKILLGTVTFKNDGDVNSYSGKAAGVADTSALYFYYSISPYGDGYEDDAHFEDTSWGALAFEFDQA